MVEGVRDGEEIPVREVVAERRDLVQRIRDRRHAISCAHAYFDTHRFSFSYGYHRQSGPH